ncbi:MAG: DUF1491 family protein [Qipengyuania sp.]
MDARLPAHLEISGLIRAAEAAGGFATVLSRGERDAGVVLILTRERDRSSRLWERMPQLDGSREFTCTREENTENKEEFFQYVKRRGEQDPDAWVLELENVNFERLVGNHGY